MSNRVESLTDYLVQTCKTETPYAEAIHHPFLKSAGNGTIDKSLFCLWLSQDRIYAAYAYPKFIGSLIAAIPFNKSVPLKMDESNREILKTLTACLENIVKEVEFFMAMAEKHGLDLEMWKERKGTRDYVAEMDSIANSKNIEEGLIFLWAMEKVYLDAWTFVRAEFRKRFSDSEQRSMSPTDSLVQQFVENWTSPEFVKFVEALAILANATKVPLQRATEIWERVIELEKDFWPVAGEDIHMRRDGP
ncbi:Heme oxygenase-like protein [Mycena venus]|uniref:Heme oxygenase-like protein n=1 Tax=Mycena venus TaxID=2733690 RepID=A0A8H6XG99_9AGAR|nr:Heme oxygenase-like protein [Mycena venus]